MLMATTMKLIGKKVLSADTASVTFSNIPNNMADLWLVTSIRTNRASTAFDGISLQFNADTGSNMSSRTLRGNGATASSFTTAAAQKLDIDAAATGSTATASTFGSTEVYIPNYAGSTNKSLSVTSLMETNATTSYIQAVAGLWAQTAAISTISVTPSSGTLLVSGSSVYLYGITKS